MENQIHSTAPASARAEANAPGTMNPTGARAPKMAKTIDLIRPGGYVRPRIATALGTEMSSGRYPDHCFADDYKNLRDTAAPIPPRARQTLKGMGDLQNPEPMFAATTRTYPISQARFGPLSLADISVQTSES